ncbi:MAG: helix-turn-helix transcriptional regulator [Clostridiales bacterium]|nr:helix-turn-helix transcriptional regulator [Clostridiales bacterium]
MKNSIGQNIAYYRKKLGMTQEGLSEKMNVTAQAVSKWENDISY